MSDARYLEEGIYPDCFRAGDLVLLESSNGGAMRIRAFDPKSLLVRWTRAYSGQDGDVAMGSSRRYAEGKRFVLYEQHQSRRLVAIDSMDGRPVWNVDLTTSSVSPPSGLPLACGDVFVIPQEDEGAMRWRLLALDAATGERRWSYEAPTDAEPAFGRPRSAQVAASCNGNRAVVAVEHDGIRIVDTVDGLETGRYRIDDIEVARGALAVSESLLVWAQRRGASVEVDAFDLSSERALWRQPRPGVCSAPERILIDDDGIYLLGRESAALNRADGRVGKSWSEIGWGKAVLTSEHRLVVSALGHPLRGAMALGRDAGGAPFGERATVRGIVSLHQRVPFVDVCIGGATARTDAEGRYEITADLAHALTPRVIAPESDWDHRLCPGNHPIWFVNGKAETVLLNGAGLYAANLECR
ncbi:Hypothetical protein A7982_06093 [Minicystis rosea]|nr:Hypothetical protein A7982_06093 [Minicystis rosea]